ncbi:alpha-amylase family glycosyl hydrolase [Microbulbifer sediminum]|uniref:alpha-amylase family glycosyl hydrolase n=1 Tax=Microbulbifer sediminum TaxID=2904250 RepID=UPI001F02BA19|nr:alpha-amylase family glycosyl hydrolase [Microbulbifer sediminum]
MIRYLLPALAAVLLAACQQRAETGPGPAEISYEPEPYVKVEHPQWSRNASIYQLNTRQFTEQGTFSAARKQLPRIKALGTDIIWLMPIHPIGKENRKGTLGSPYSVKDYYGVNPEFGSLEDLKEFIDAAHALDMYVILDWVANHTAWDNELRYQHPEWYERDHNGNFRPTPWWDWSDIIDLDYSKPGLRKYMTEAMAYWVEEVNVDGFRADVAGFVPLDFWENARRRLDSIKPVFMLAEWESRDLHEHAFDMTYAWSWWDIMHAITQGKAGLDRLFTYYSWDESAYPRDSYRMVFVSNHDKNSWEATQYEAFGQGLEATIVLSVVGEGMPLVYNGQEAGNRKRLEFFEKDPIEWKADPTGDLYQTLLHLKKENTALWNGAAGATMVKVPNSSPQEVFSFIRENERDKIFAVMNFSGQEREVTFADTLYPGAYTELFSQQEVELDRGLSLRLPPWGYRVYVQ